MRRLDVIVLQWNGAEDTCALLPTLEQCRLPEGWEARVIVVDNGSSDGSADRVSRAFPSIELMRLTENRLFAGGNNAGLKRALAEGADAIMLLNNDTEADPQLYEKLLLALEENPRAGAVAPLIYHAPPTRRIWYAGGTCKPWAGWTSHRGLRARDTGQYRVIEETGYLTGCCLLARRETWERVGLLDEAYHIYAEDADWSLRAKASGVRLLFVPTARLWHKVSSASGGASNAWKIYQRLRANLRLFSRHARGPGRVTWLPAFLVQQAALAGWLIARGKLGAAAAVPRALVDALRGRPAREVRA